MSNERELIIAELWDRLYQTSGVVRVSRNPGGANPGEQHPCINFFELSDTVTKRGKRNDRIDNRRELHVAVEAFVAGSSEETASTELLNFVADMKSKIFPGGDSTLGSRCEIGEIESTGVAIVTGGKPIRGIGIKYLIIYTEVL